MGCTTSRLPFQSTYPAHYQGAMREFFAALPFGSHLVPFVPSSRTIVTLAPPAAIYGYLAITLAGHLRVRRAVRTAYTRKVFHFMVFTMATIVEQIGRAHV